MLVTPQDFYNTIYSVLAQNAAAQAASQQPQPQPQQPQPQVPAAPHPQPQQTNVQTDSSQQAKSDDDKIRLKDLILPIVAGAIAGISPKAAAAVNIASGLYKDLRHIKHLRDIENTKKQREMESRQRTDRASQVLLNPNSTPGEAVASLLSAGVPANAIPDIIARRYGMSLEEAIKVMKDAPPDLSLNLPLGAGGEISRNVNVQQGSPTVKEVYDPKTGTTNIVSVYQHPGREPQTTSFSVPGVPGESAAARLVGSQGKPSSRSSSGKYMTGIDPNTGRLIIGYIPPGSTTAKPVEGLVPLPKGNGHSTVTRAKQLSDLIGNLLDVYKEAMQNGNEETAKQALAAIQHYQDELSAMTGNQPAASGGGRLTPEQEAEQYFAKKGRWNKLSER